MRRVGKEVVRMRKEVANLMKTPFSLISPFWKEAKMSAF